MSSSPATSAHAGRASAALARAGGALLLALATACAAPEEQAPPPAGSFDRLIARGVPRPVEAEVVEGEPAEGARDADLGDGTALPVGERAAELAAAQGPDHWREQTSPNPYLEFGSRIIVHANGLITKPFSLPPGKAAKILELMGYYATFPVRVVPENAEGAGSGLAAQASPDYVLAEILDGWDLEYFLDLRKDQTGPATQVPLADWLLITATPALLTDVEFFLTLFLAEVPQIEIEAKIVEVTESEELDVGVGPSSVTFPPHTAVEALDFQFENLAAGSAEGLLTVGAVQDGVTYDFLIEAAEAMENVEISAMPRIAVRENARAELLNTQDLPTLNVSGITQSGNYSASLQYKEVGIKLFVVPRVVGKDTIALAIDIEASQQIGTQVFFTTSSDSGTTPAELTAPVIANRSAKTVVYLKPGEGLILGGLTRERVVESVQRVPILGRIPLLGLLFRSTYDRTERTSVLFFIRPRLLEGLDFQREF